MTSSARIAAATVSVAMIAAVNLVAAAYAPPEWQLWLRLTSVLATAAAVQSAAWDRSDLFLVLLLSTPPVVALAAETSPTWLIAPLAALLLVSAELNALSWELQGRNALDAARRRRLLQIGLLGALGLAGAAVVSAAASLPVPAGMPAVLLAATAVSVLGGVLFAQR